jgi:hypothetical protein
MSVVHGFLTDIGVITSQGEPVEGEKWFVVEADGKLCSGPYPDGFTTEAEALLWAQKGKAA